MKCFEDVNMVAVELFCSGGKCGYVCVCVGGGGRGWGWVGGGWVGGGEEAV